MGGPGMLTEVDGGVGSEDASVCQTAFAAHETAWIGQEELICKGEHEYSEAWL